MTGAASSAVKRSPRTSSSPVASMTAPREPPMPVISRIAPVVLEALAHRRVSAGRSRCVGQHVGTEQADEQREVGVAEERDEVVGDPRARRRRRTRSAPAGRGSAAGRDRAVGGASRRVVLDPASSGLLLEHRLVGSSSVSGSSRGRRSSPEDEVVTIAVTGPSTRPYNSQVPRGSRAGRRWRPRPVPGSRRRSRRRCRPRARRPCAASRPARLGRGRTRHGRGQHDLHVHVDRGEDRRHRRRPARTAAAGRRPPLTSTSTIFLKAPMACSIAPMSTPKPMSRPTSAMISPNPSGDRPRVPVKPTPVARPR